MKRFICKSRYVISSYMEVIYDVKRMKNVNDIVDTIKNINGIEIVNIVQNNTETMG